MKNTTLLLSGFHLVTLRKKPKTKAQKLRTLVTCSEDIVWYSPKRYDSMTSIMKSQIDWIPLSIRSLLPKHGYSLMITTA